MSRPSKLKVSPQRLDETKNVRQSVQLARLLLGPVDTQLAHKRLVIVADGALQSLPFAALRTLDGKQPLLTAHELVNLPSISALSQLRQDMAGRAPAPRTIAVIADPVFEANDVRITHKRAAAARPVPANPAAAIPSMRSETRPKKRWRLHRILP